MKKITLLLLVFMSLSNANAQDGCKNVMSTLLDNINEINGITERSFDLTIQDIGTFSQSLNQILFDARYDSNSNKRLLVDDLSTFEDLVTKRSETHKYNMKLITDLIKKIQRYCSLQSK